MLSSGRMDPGPRRKADPIFGTGFNTYSYGEHIGGYGDTHNLYVKVLVETGLAGLILFLSILYRLYKLGFQLYQTGSDSFLMSLGLGFAGLMVTAVMANLFGDRWMYFQITGYTYAFAALTVRGLELSAEPDSERTNEPVEGAAMSEVLA